MIHNTKSFHLSQKQKEHDISEIMKVMCNPGYNHLCFMLTEAMCGYKLLEPVDQELLNKLSRENFCFEFMNILFPKNISVNKNNKAFNYMLPLNFYSFSINLSFSFFQFQFFICNALSKISLVLALSYSTTLISSFFVEIFFKSNCFCA